MPYDLLVIKRFLKKMQKMNFSTSTKERFILPLIKSVVGEQRLKMAERLLVIMEASQSETEFIEKMKAEFPEL